MRVMIAHVREMPPAPSEIRPEVPADLEQIVLRCLAKSPADRYPDASSLQEALERCEAAWGWSRRRAAEWWHVNEARV
jgi:serine/threonine-protein kinase